MKPTMKNLPYLELLKNMKLSKIDFIRGLGIIEHRFVLSFESNDEKMNIEIETNFRIRDKNKILLCFNDLYIDLKRKVMSIKKYRSQTNIEKSYLSKQLEMINCSLKGAKPKRIICKEYGDIIIAFSKKGIVFEIQNDTHVEDAVLYRILYKKGDYFDAYECLIENNSLVLKQMDLQFAAKIL